VQKPLSLQEFQRQLHSFFTALKSLLQFYDERLSSKKGCNYMGKQRMEEVMVIMMKNRERSLLIVPIWMQSRPLVSSDKKIDKGLPH
jgi:hypothetical protein